ncbi:ring-cleaving dioxygenase [Deminuibacter soli]|uniref:Ring-cleaving dioxygenase n=1 Tax=Deminuibacter soli TaxID=2291815 RepID=A0A3E1NP10_9BACT|nr:ring-cleaving dioxygenase [Deminuibacter soli]RFM29671.1 ring-cleaving dioxygenase [Deminuibacter soli]
MENTILGLHHITAIADNARVNYDFYTRIMGLRMVKKTVNFDDPGTYHFYYGNEQGAPGTILTFFPWEGIGKGHTGTGMATEIGYAVPAGSLDYWKQRFKQLHVNTGEETTRFGEACLPFTDPDGLHISLLVPANADSRTPWAGADVRPEAAATGFHSVSLTLQSVEATARLLTDVFGYHFVSQEGSRYRFATNAVAEAAIVDLIEEPSGKPGRNAAGTNHHVAFRVADETVQMAFHDKLSSLGFQVTPKINRDYFYSLYFREAGGVLFEIATDNPGFTVDEPLDQLGSSLKLPKQYEPGRAEIEKMLPSLH